MIVLDASAAVEMVRRSDVGEEVITRIDAQDGSVHVPQLLTIEVAQVLRRLVAAGEVAPDRAADALDDLMALPAMRHEHDPLLPRVWALRKNLTAYDAVYVALAEELGATLLTLDRRLASAPGHTANVELLAPV